MRKILVIGSLNIDVIQNMSRLPKQGETLSLISKATNFGGKGANQAVAAARQGASVGFIGAVGADAEGSSYKALLQEEGINVASLTSKEDSSTGTAYIMLEADGNNTILVHGGANMALTADDVAAAEAQFVDADVVVAQLEVTSEAIAKGFELAHKYGAMTILNPAPVTDKINPQILTNTDLLIPNETEAAALIKLPATVEYAELVKRIPLFEQKLGINNIIITLGADGSFYSINGTHGLIASRKVNAVDTTAAGDTFIGTIATVLEKDYSNIETTLKRASVASSIVVSRPGAIPAIPTATEVLTVLSD